LSAEARLTAANERLNHLEALLEALHDAVYHAHQADKNDTADAAQKLAYTTAHDIDVLKATLPGLEHWARRERAEQQEQQDAEYVASQ
jgi:hypothetical protein